MEIKLVLIPGRYISAECQGQAHWGCPGGIRARYKGGAVERIRCTCSYPDCSCSTKVKAPA